MKPTKFIFMCLFLSSCGLMSIDAPPIDRGDIWVKSGFTNSMTWKELYNCGYSEENYSESMIVNVDWCMLKKGFKYVDASSKIMGRRGICIYPEYKNRPSCRYLRGELQLESMAAQSNSLSASQPSKTNISESPAFIRKPEVNNKTIDCRKSSPYYEKAYCECQSGRRYSVNDPCEYLLKNKGNN